MVYADFGKRVLRVFIEFFTADEQTENDGKQRPYRFDVCTVGIFCGYVRNEVFIMVEKRLYIAL